LKRHHTTVLYLLRAHDELLQSDKQYRTLAESFGDVVVV